MCFRPSRSSVIVFLLLLMTFAYFDQGGGSNQNATIGEIREFVEHGSVDITSWTRVTGDFSMFNGHYYSNKSPSVFFFAVPVYAVIAVAAKTLHVDLASSSYQFFANRILTILVACVWGALLGPLLMKLFQRLRPDWTSMTNVGISLMIPLSTLIFPYATVGFVHVFETFWAVMVYDRWLVLMEEPDNQRSGVLFAVSLGILVLANPINVALVPFVIAFAWRTIEFKTIVKLGLWTAIPLVPLLIYNHVLFGSVFKTNRHFLPSVFADPKLFLGVYGPPDFSHLSNIFGLGHRSIFPGHVMLFLGMLPGNIKKLYGLGGAKLFIPLLVIVLGILHLLCFNGWWGGWAFGPRYFLPGLTMLVILSLQNAEKHVGKTALVLFAGYMIHLVVTSIDMMPSDRIMNPWAVSIFPKLRDGPQMEFFVGSFPFNSTGATKFNLGHLLGLNRWYSIIPLMIVQLTLGYVLYRVQKSRSSCAEASHPSA